MTFEPQLIDNVAPGESLRSGADKINQNFQAVAEEISNLELAGVPDVVGGMLTGTQTGITVSYDDTANELDFVIAYGNGANTACQGNDARLSDTRTPKSHTHTSGDLTDATATPTANKIPIADQYGTIDDWLSSRILTTDEAAALTGTIGTPSSTNPYATSEDIEGIIIDIKADLLDLSYIPSGYTPTATPDASDITQIAAHLNGISAKLANLESRLTAHSI